MKSASIRVGSAVPTLAKVPRHPRGELNSPCVLMLVGGLLPGDSAVDPLVSIVSLFSTTVNRMSLRDLERGRVDSTGGTDIACVIEHALKDRVRKTLIVTDGYVGEPSDAHAAAIRQSCLEVRVALTPEGWRKDLETVSARMDELPGGDGAR